MADEHTRTLLERGAGALPTTPPHAEIEHRAERLRLRRRVAVSSGATALVIVVLAGVLGFAASIHRRQPEVALGGADRTAATGGQAAAGGCLEPAYHPGYLPWLDVGAPIPPAGSVSRTPSGTTLRWSDGAGADAFTVTVARRHGTVTADDGPYVPGGGRLSLHRGGRARVVWNVGGRRCNVLELVLTAPPRTMDGDELQRAVMGIARSLATPDGWPFEPADPAVCPPPPVMPTYLPWLPAGGPVPTPQIVYDSAQSDGYDVVWERAGTARDSGTGVWMDRSSNAVNSGRGEPTGHEILGQEGLLLTDEPGAVGAAATIVWDLGSGPCRNVRLYFESDDAMTRAQIDREILRIADSLAPLPPDADVLDPLSDGS
jgi:hypothetical protein